MTANTHATRDSIARHSKSFALAARLLRPDIRDDVAGLYAWCRACDDAIDLGTEADPAVTMVALDRELDSIYDRQPQQRAVADAFQRVVHAYGIPLAYPRELLAGLRMDVDQDTYASVDDLLVYCFRVAGTVGLMMCHVLGASDPRALPHAAHLGIAMQLTNICRDVAEDWQRGRLYVPRQLLADDVFAALMAQRQRPFPPELAPALVPALRQLLSLAERYYASGDRGLAYLPWRAALGVRTARLVYAGIGDEIAKRGHDVLAGRAVVSGRRKVRLTTRAAIRTLIEAPRRLRVVRAGRLDEVDARKQVASFLLSSVRELPA
jgi:phytoene synthase